MSIIYSISFASNLKIYEEIFEPKREVYSRAEHNPLRGSDGNGRHGKLKISWRNLCGFESRLPY